MPGISHWLPSLPLVACEPHKTLLSQEELIMFHGQTDWGTAKTG